MRGWKGYKKGRGSNKKYADRGMGGTAFHPHPPPGVHRSAHTVSRTPFPKYSATMTCLRVGAEYTVRFLHGHVTTYQQSNAQDRGVTERDSNTQRTHYKRQSMEYSFRCTGKSCPRQPTWGVLAQRNGQSTCQRGHVRAHTGENYQR